MTTTPRVAAKSGVIRGAQVHHFRSKTDLVVAAIKHLTAKPTVLRELDGIDTTGGLFGAILDFRWEVPQGPMFPATAELRVVARTDRALAAELAGVESYVNSALFEAVSRLVPETTQRDLRGFIYTAIESVTSPDSSTPTPSWPAAAGTAPSPTSAPSPADAQPGECGSSALAAVYAGSAQ